MAYPSASDTTLLSLWNMYTHGAQKYSTLSALTMGKMQCYCVTVTHTNTHSKSVCVSANPCCKTHVSGGLFLLPAAMFHHSTRVCLSFLSFVYRKCVKVCVLGFSENDVCMDVCKQYMREASGTVCSHHSTDSHSGDLRLSKSQTHFMFLVFS